MIVKKLGVVLIVLVLVVAAAYVFVERTTENVRVAIDSELASQQETLHTYADALFRNTVVPGSGAFVTDCTGDQRKRFDSLLINLAALPDESFSELRLLFSACAHYSAERKSLTLALFNQEIDTLASLLTIQSNYEYLDDAEAAAKVASWRAVYELEKKRTDVLREQVALQLEIIDLLESGATPENDAVQDRVREAAEVEQRGSVLAQEVTAARAAIK